MLSRFYDQGVLQHPKKVLFFLLCLLSFLAYEATQLQVDASAETLTLENDLDLQYSREVNQRYGSPDFLVITYQPQADLLAEPTLQALRALKADLLEIDGVSGVTSILDVPLLQSPPKPLKELLKKVPTLESPGIDKALAKEEFLHSPIYRNLLVSPDFRTTALQVELDEDTAWQNFIQRRYTLREKQKSLGLNEKEQTELAQLQTEFKSYRNVARARQHRIVAQVRAAMDQHREKAQLFLGGVAMIADDLITYIKSDLRIFGTGVLTFLVITLWIIFRQFRWILIPLVTCGLSVLATSGFLGLFGWEVTVISSNFISIQLIITMAITIHLIVRYREFYNQHPEWEQKKLARETVLAMAQPCLYMALTTVAGFFSLLLSGILPVINFGWMMSVGISVSLILTFLLFPILLLFLPKKSPNVSFEKSFKVTLILANLTEKRGRLIFFVSGVLAVLCISGALQLRVENSFIDYFKKSTEIYQGMKVIDQQLGGTTPLDIILDFPPEKQAPPPTTTADAEDEFSDFDQFEEEFNSQASEAQYWFTSAKMAEVERVHDYLDRLPETGKVLSLATMLKIGVTLNEGQPLDNFLLALIYKELPERFKKIVLNPYVSVQDNQVRFYLRVRDSDPNLRRNELLQTIQRDLKDKLRIPPERTHLTSLLVLYNNMLQSLFNSQIETLGAVIAALMIMFMLLFRSFKLSYIAILPNLLSVGTVLGFMGWADIPLDMMTITIAAISVGIAVDDTIHYIHRFEIEYAKDHQYIAAMHRCHGSIGYAMYYTSVTIIIGFSILVLSNFIPSIYFGLLTGLAMIIAWATALTLLPRLIVDLKPFGPEAG